MGRKTLKATYGMIKNYKNQPSCNWLTLAEFIDNSISSYQNKNDNNPIEGLEIRIVYKYTNDDLKIIISDNANGMSESELADAMQPSDRRNKKDNQYNQYGVGMKLGIFWNGQDGIVYSKQKNKKEYVVELKTSDKNEGEEVVVDSTKSIDNVIKYESGTTVIIDNVYDNRKLKSGDIDEIKKALGWRYNRLLENNNESVGIVKKGMKIRIFVDHPDSRATSYNEVINVDPFYIKPFTQKDFFEIKSKTKNYDINKFLNNHLIEIEKLKNEYKDNQKYKILLEFCDKYINNEPLYSTIERYVNNQKVNINFGIISSSSEKMSKGFSNISGLTTYHIKRAINHGPKNSKNVQQNCIQFTDTSIGSSADPTWRRLYGDVDLTNVESPDQNKSRFDWSPSGYENLTESLKEIWNALRPLLDLIIKFEKYTTTVAITDTKDKEKLVKSSLDSLNQDVIKSEMQTCPETNKKEPCFVFPRGEKKFFIIEDGEKTNFIKSIESQESESDIYIYFNQNHPFWKPYINDAKNNVEFRGNSIYPIILLVAICNDCLKGEEYTEFLTDNISKKFDSSLEDIINDVVYHIEKQES